MARRRSEEEERRARGVHLELDPVRVHFEHFACPPRPAPPGQHADNSRPQPTSIQPRMQTDTCRGPMPRAQIRPPTRSETTQERNREDPAEGKVFRKAAVHTRPAAPGGQFRALFALDFLGDRQKDLSGLAYAPPHPRAPPRGTSTTDAGAVCVVLCDPAYDSSLDSAVNSHGTFTTCLFYPLC